jgi:Cu/Zn superoxide dismutase
MYSRHPFAFCAGAQAVSEDVPLNLVTSQGVGQSIGSVKITETDRGLEFAPICGRYRRASTAFIFMLKAAASRR